MRPMLSTFIRLTVVITVALIAIVLLGWALHVIAAVVVGALFLYNIFRRRSGAPVIR